MLLYHEAGLIWEVYYSKSCEADCVKVEAGGDCETAALASFDPPHIDCFCDFDFLLSFYLFYPRLPISCLFISHHDRGGWRFK